MWVIERFENERSQGYWAGESSRDFVADIDRAVQFVRREDAWRIRRGWHWKDTQVTEHLMLASPEPPRQTGYESMDLVEPICRAICKVEALNPDEPQDSEQEPNWVRYADAVQQTLLSAKVSPERTCSMHGELCLDASVHHFLKYHDPRSDFYIGTGCGKCAYSEVEKLRESPRQSQESYWCCKADFGQHEPTCKNAPSSHSEPELVKLREAIGYIRGLLNENRPNGETVLKIRGYVTGVEIALSATLASTQNENLSSGEAK